MNKLSRFLSSILLFGVSFVTAEDTLSDDDIFGGSVFDQSIKESTLKDSAAALEYLKGIFLAAEASATTSNFAHYGSDTRFFGSAFVKASKQDIGSLHASCIFNHFLFAAANDSGFARQYRLQSPDPSRIDASLSEFHFSTDIQKKVFIRAGKQLISWGAAYFWSPEDFVNQERAQVELLAPIDIRTGKPGLRLHAPLDNFNLFLFTDFSGVTINTIPRPLLSGIGQAWRFDGTFAGINIGTVGYIAKGAPVRLGVDATGNLSGTDIYGEAAFRMPDTAHSSITSALSIGATRLLGQEKNWTLRAEAYVNDTGYSDTPISDIPRGSFVPFYSGRYYLYGEVSAKKLLQSTLDAALFCIVNAADRSYTATLQGTFDYPGVVPFTLYTRYYGGKKDREFTYRNGMDALQGGMRLVVSF